MTAPVCSTSSSIAVLLMTFVFWIQWPWLVEQTQIFYILSRIRVKETLKNVELVDVVMVLGVRRLVAALPVRRRRLLLMSSAKWLASLLDMRQVQKK